jgi:hypothetical protein
MKSIIRWLKTKYYTIRLHYTKPYSDEYTNYRLKIYMVNNPYVAKPITQDEYETFDPSKLFKISTPEYTQKLDNK